MLFLFVLQQEVHAQEARLQPIRLRMQDRTIDLSRCLRQEIGCLVAPLLYGGGLRVLVGGLLPLLPKEVNSLVAILAKDSDHAAGLLGQLLPRPIGPVKWH